MHPPQFSPAASPSMVRDSGILADQREPAGAKPTGSEPEKGEQNRRGIADVVISFFKGLWRHKSLLATGIVSTGVGLATIFADVVGMGLPAPFLAPLTVGSFSVGGGYVTLAILIAFYEAINDSVTLCTSAEKKQFVLDMVNRNEFNGEELAKLYDAVMDRYSPITSGMDLEFPGSPSAPD